MSKLVFYKECILCGEHVESPADTAKGYEKSTNLAVHWHECTGLKNIIYELSSLIPEKEDL